MDTSTMNRLVGLMTPEEIRDGFWLVQTFERWGSMTPAEANEWRRRIVARQQFLVCPADPARVV